MTTIIGISGSLRQGSFNTRLLRAIAAAAPSGGAIELATIEGIPLYDGDVEAKEGIPARVTALKERIATADGVLVVTPEYNNSIPGVFKNAIDWLSRPPSDIERVFGNKPVALTGATPGRGATSLSQAAWLPVLRALGVRPWFGPRLGIAGAAKVFGDDGGIVDAQVKELVEQFVRGFVAFVERETKAG